MKPNSLFFLPILHFDIPCHRSPYTTWVSLSHFNYFDSHSIQASTNAAYHYALKHRHSSTLLSRWFSRYNQARIPVFAHRVNQGPFRARWAGIEMCVFTILPRPPPLPPSFTSGLVESQVTELVTIRRSLFDLEAQHERAHNHYEDEIKRIRSDLITARQSGAGASPVVLGIPGRSPRQLGTSVPLPNTPAMSEAPTSSQFHRHRDREREVDRPKETIEREWERVGDQRDAKRHKTRRDYSGLSCIGW